ncbi:MAG: class C beta-lactamase-related serine hydrolase [Candidatus Abyssobacteria bacterium SURF_17]|uniref:Class C beta-lactamase-related serine hydrolase n=1 Tax=Candidatus Abyssobacteria bacterium SURF_17 TaxID=2093361 RepID=A0A419EP69_9BACT|nr:MAG: class C beta-lactamase-related serine hydrolase [Candidatus Abyssubacteria bacterium SURF_17]
MRRTTGKIILGVALFILLLIGFAAYYLFVKIAPIGAGYKAKMLCSYLFVSNRELAPILENDLEPFNPLMPLVDTEVDYENKSVTATAFGLVTRRAVFNDCLGCTLIPPSLKSDQLKFATACVDPEPANPEDVPWPTGDLNSIQAFPTEIDENKLQAALDKEFSEPNSEKPRRARAVVVLYQGHIVAERYAPGFGVNTRMHGWSMSKSITSALIGILVGQGKFSVNDPAPIPEWKNPDDPHSRITIDHLLHMSGGFDFHHDLSPAGQRQQALFGAIDSVAYAISCPLDVAPGSRWEYANANPHALWRIIRDAVGADENYLQFPRRALFNRIGMRNAIIEPDPYGNFIGTSFGWATARDWARFGLLYLNDGVWEGERILPEGWVEYTRTPAPKAPLKQYGALFWLNAGAKEFANISPEEKGGRNAPPFPRLPEDAYFAMGHDGQVVAVIPSHQLVVVRLGLSRSDETWDYEGFLADILAAVKE